MARRGASKQPRDRRGRWTSYGAGGSSAGASSGGAKRKMTFEDSVNNLKRLKKESSSASAPRNAIKRSPRNLTKNEKIAAEVMASRKFRSDKQRRAEMIKRGISPKTDFVELVGRARDKNKSKRK